MYIYFKFVDAKVNQKALFAHVIGYFVEIKPSCEVFFVKLNV